MSLYFKTLKGVQNTLDTILDLEKKYGFFLFLVMAGHREERKERYFVCLICEINEKCVSYVIYIKIG